MRDEKELEQPEDPVPTGDELAVPPRVIPASELFGDAREVRVEFHGELYRLRITRRNKLILQK